MIEFKPIYDDWYDDIEIWENDVCVSTVSINVGKYNDFVEYLSRQPPPKTVKDAEQAIIRYRELSDEKIACVLRVFEEQKRLNKSTGDF